MCNCASVNGGTHHDQTQLEHIEALNRERADPRTVVGSGLFLVPDPAAGVREFKKIVVEDITYKDCSLRGEHCTAFKWIPYPIVEKEEVRNRALLCKGFCYDVRSADGTRSHKGCGPSCICIITSYDFFGNCY